MRYMGWSWADLMACPDPVISVIVDVARHESDTAGRKQQ